MFQMLDLVDNQLVAATEKERTFFKTLGRNIQHRRGAEGKTQEIIAEAVGISTRSYQAIEAGSQRPKLLTMVKIARALDCAVDDLVPTMKI